MKYSLDQITLLHKKYAPGEAVYRLIFEHCQIVCEIAEQLAAAQNVQLDMGLVRTGALLHDIGAYPLFNTDSTLRSGVSYITHGIRGEEILKAEGFPRAIWHFASHHTGVGLTKDDIARQQLPLPIADYLAETDEEELVMYADKFHSKKSPPEFHSYETYREHVAQFGADKVKQFEALAKKFGTPDLIPLSQKYGYKLY